MNQNKKVVPYGKCKFCGTAHRFLKTCCPAFQYVCQTCNEENHYEQFCPTNKKEGKTTIGVLNGAANRPMRVNNPLPKATCLFCGESHPPDMSVCSAIGKFCCNCGKPNHTEKVCPQKWGIPLNKVPSPACGFCQNPNHSERECRNKNIGGNKKSGGMTKQFGSLKNVNFDGRMKHCNFCAEEHSVVKGSCPAYGQKCSYCNKKDHVTKACEVRIRNEKKKLGGGNVFGSSKSSKSASMGSLNIPMGNETVDTKTETKENKENSEENGQEKGGAKQKKNIVSKKKQPVKKKLNSFDSSSDSDNDNDDLNEKKAKRLIEVASYYLMWQEYPKAKDYLIKAKLLSHLPEVDEKLAEITKLMSQSSVN